MALTWDQIGNLGLTTAQKNKLAQAEALGVAIARRERPDTSGVTAAQAKQIRNFVNDMRQRLEPAMLAADYIIRKMREDAARAADDAVPDNPL